MDLQAKQICYPILAALLVWASGCASHQSSSPPGALPPSWYTPPKGPSSAPVNPLPDPGPETDAAVRSVFQANTTALSSVATQAIGSGSGDTVPWHLDGAIADFAVSTNGVLGSLLTNGYVGVRGTWQRADAPESPPKAKPLRQTLKNKSALLVRSGTTSADITGQLEPTIRSLIAAGLVSPQDESVFRTNLKSQANQFLKFCKDLESVHLNGWDLNTFELQLSFSGNGQITPVIGAGGSFNVYFDWVKPADIESPGPSQAVQTGLSDFAQELTNEFSAALQESPEPEHSPLTLQQFQINLGVGANGNIGILQAQTGISARIAFAKTEPQMSELRVQRRTWNQGSVGLIVSPAKPAARIDGDKLREGIVNALKMARYFVQRAKEADTSQWKLVEIESEYDLTLGGDMTLVSPTGLAGVILDYDR